MCCASGQLVNMLFVQSSRETALPSLLRRKPAGVREGGEREEEG